MVLDAAGAVARFIQVFAAVYGITLIVYVLTSWVQLPYSLKPVQRFLYDVCEPYLRLWRRILPFRAGPIDFSPMVAIIALGVVSQIVFSILTRF
ncbi:MAG: YggT family protein [Actinomycetota bacterium]|jgi:YggT family protein|nr:YggT family protein [Actinomycetota bacterium]